jgi:hypothetical protein
MTQPNSTPREIDLFTDKANATERTLRALGNLGFKVELNTKSIDGTEVATYTESTSSFRDTVPEIAASYTDPISGNTVRLGMDINAHDVERGPFNWAGRASHQSDGAELAGGGNHDNNQPELVRQLENLLAAAHFDKPAGSIPTWTPEYKKWEASVQADLSPIYYASPPPQA